MQRLWFPSLAVCPSPTLPTSLALRLSGVCLEAGRVLLRVRSAWRHTSSGKRPLDSDPAVADTELPSKRPRVTTPHKEACAPDASATQADHQHHEEACASTRAETPEAARRSDSVRFCAICCENAVPQGAAFLLRCGHGWYCAECMARYAEARIAAGAVDVPCPECGGEPLAERDLRTMLPEHLVEQLLARSLDQAVSSAADLWPCPTPGCSMRAVLEASAPSAEFRCKLCAVASCLRCGAQPYHAGLTCEEHAKRRREDADVSFARWMEETGTKQCPRCRMAITKENLDKQARQYSECHKMLCRNCGMRFCFKCLAELTETFSCRCSNPRHGFIDPYTRDILPHIVGRGNGPAVVNAAAAAARCGGADVTSSSGMPGSVGSTSHVGGPPSGDNGRYRSRSGRGRGGGRGVGELGG